MRHTCSPLHLFPPSSSGSLMLPACSVFYSITNLPAVQHLACKTWQARLDPSQTRVVECLSAASVNGKHFTERRRLLMLQNTSQTQSACHSLDYKTRIIIHIWLLLLQDAPYLLESAVQGFTDEEDVVQLALLAAAMKLFFKRPPECQQLLGATLAAASAESSQDVHDRALLYYRSAGDAYHFASCTEASSLI